MNQQFHRIALFGAIVLSSLACNKKAEPAPSPATAEPGKAAEAPKAAEAAKPAEAPPAAEAAKPAPAAAAPEGLDAKVLELVGKGDGKSLTEAVDTGLPYLLTAQVADGAYVADQKIVSATVYAFEKWWAFVSDLTKPEADRVFARNYLVPKLAMALGDVNHPALHAVIGRGTAALLALHPESRPSFVGRAAARTDKTIINLDMMTVRDTWREVPQLLAKDAPAPNTCAELSTDVLRATNNRDVEDAFVGMWAQSKCVLKLTGPQKEAAAKVLDEHFDRMTAVSRDQAIKAYAAMCAKTELAAQVEKIKAGKAPDKDVLQDLAAIKLSSMKCD